MKNPYLSVAKRVMRFRQKPLVAKRQGALWLLYPSDWIDNRLLIGSPFEREQLNFVKKCVKDNKLTLFYDCGANIGLYSVLLGLEDNSLQNIHAFEPVPHNWGRLISNVTINHLIAKVKCHNIGLGAANETLDIYINKKSSGTSTLLKEKTKNTAKQTVIIKKFDELFKSSDERAFFKIDVEGYEAKTLEGMQNYLENNRCILQIELWDKSDTTIKDWLNNIGYKPIHQIEHDFYFSNLG